ncbi:unnamed protein product [Cunninghamella echinulata]
MTRFGKEETPSLTRQGAFHERDRPHLFQQSSPTAHPNEEVEEAKRCTICLNTREGETEYITPCCCRGSVQYVHEQCLKDWILKSPQCNVCLGYYSLPKKNQPLWNAYRMDYQILANCLVLLMGTMIIALSAQFIRCTEPKKVSVSKLHITKREDGPDYLWVPVFKKTCWYASACSILSPYQYISLFLLTVGFIIFQKYRHDQR